jgi:hypothetical protein
LQQRKQNRSNNEIEMKIHAQSKKARQLGILVKIASFLEPGNAVNLRKKGRQKEKHQRRAS